jgi:hypothetical protein
MAGEVHSRRSATDDASFSVLGAQESPEAAGNALGAQNPSSPEPQGVLHAVVAVAAVKPLAPAQAERRVESPQH